jgi:hypothetical protein
MTTAALDLNHPEREVRLDSVRSLGHQNAFFRSDAASLWFQKELEHTITTQYEVRFPELKMAEGAVIPIRGTIPKGKRSGVYKMYDYTGVAKWLTTGSWKDIPKASAKGKRATFDVHEYAMGYGWELGELEEAQATNTPLLQFEANAASRGLALFLDAVGWFGDVAKGCHGLTNHPNITVIDAAQGAANAYRWGTYGSTSKTGLEMVADVALGIRTMRSVTKNVQRPNRCMLPSTFWERAQHQVYNATGGNQSVMKFLRETYPEIVFEEHRQLDTAGTYGGPVIMFIHVSSPDDLWFECPIQKEQHGPFQDGLTFGALMRSSTGGIITPYPQAILRMDFAAD